MMMDSHPVARSLGRSLVQRSHFRFGSCPLYLEFSRSVDAVSPPSTCRLVLLSPAILKTSAPSCGHSVKGKKGLVEMTSPAKSSGLSECHSKKKRRLEGCLNAILDQRGVRTFLNIL